MDQKPTKDENVTEEKCVKLEISDQVYITTEENQFPRLARNVQDLKHLKQQDSKKLDPFIREAFKVFHEPWKTLQRQDGQWQRLSLPEISDLRLSETITVTQPTSKESTLSETSDQHSSNEENKSLSEKFFKKLIRKNHDHSASERKQYSTLHKPTIESIQKQEFKRRPSQKKLTGKYKRMTILTFFQRGGGGGNELKDSKGTEEENDQLSEISDESSPRIIENQPIVKTLLRRPTVAFVDSVSHQNE